MQGRVASEELIESLQRFVGTVHEQCKATIAPMEIFTPSPNGLLAALEGNVITDDECTQNGWKVDCSEKCIETCKHINEYLDEANRKGYAELSQLTIYSEWPKIDAIRVTGEMMKNHVIGCNDAIITPPIPLGFTWKPESFQAKCQRSMAHMGINGIEKYLLLTFGWTVDHYKIKMSHPTHILDKTLKHVENDLHKAKKDYCTRPEHEINDIKNHKRTLKNCFDKYKNEIDNIIDFFLVGLNAVSKI